MAAGAEDDEASAMGALGSEGGVVDTGSGVGAVDALDRSACICDVMFGNRAGGGYFWKKRRSRGGSDFAISICFWALMVGARGAKACVCMRVCMCVYVYARVCVSVNACVGLAVGGFGQMSTTDKLLPSHLG